MRIRKAFQGTVPENKILDTYSTSQTDTYSCNYVNDITLDMFRFRKFEKSMTVPANGMSALDMGDVNVPSGYSYLGCIPIQCGYSDQWVMSFSKYDNNHIIAMAHSKWGAQLTHNVSCYAVYIKDTLKNIMIL